MRFEYLPTYAIEDVFISNRLGDFMNTFFLDNPYFWVGSWYKHCQE